MGSMAPAVAADARRDGAAALRSGGANVDDTETGELINALRSSLNRGRAPRSKAEEGRRLAVALQPAAERLACGSPELGGSALHTVLWDFTAAGTRGTAAEARLRRVADDLEGWPSLAERVWLVAIGEDEDEGGSVDWRLHLGIGVAAAGALMMCWAESGRHRLTGGASVLVGLVLAASRIPPRAKSW